MTPQKEAHEKAKSNLIASRERLVQASEALAVCQNEKAPDPNPVDSAEVAIKKLAQWHQSYQARLIGAEKYVDCCRSSVEACEANVEAAYKAIEAARRLKAADALPEVKSRYKAATEAYSEALRELVSYCEQADDAIYPRLARQVRDVALPAIGIDELNVPRGVNLMPTNGGIVTFRVSEMIA